MINWFLIALWGIAGVFTLFVNKKEIPRLSYFLCWSCLMMFLIERAILR